MISDKIQYSCLGVYSRALPSKKSPLGSLVKVAPRRFEFNIIYVQLSWIKIQIHRIVIDPLPPQ